MRLQLRKLHHAQSGQAVAFFIGIILIIFGFMAFAFDIGFFFHARRVAQNAADAAALAGASELPGCGDQDPDPLVLADEYAISNMLAKTTSSGDTFGPMSYGTHTVDGTEFKTVYARVERQQRFIFGRIFGLIDSAVPADAEASCLPINAAAICPFFIQSPNPSLDNPPEAFGIKPNNFVYRFKFDANDSQAGNRGFLGIYGSGANQIRRGIEGGCVDPDGQLDYVVSQGGDDENPDVVTDSQPGNIASVWKSIDTLYAYEGTGPYESRATCDLTGLVDLTLFPEDAPWSYTLEIPSGSQAAADVRRDKCSYDPRDGDPEDNVHGRVWPIVITDTLLSQDCKGNCTLTTDHIAMMYVVCWGERCAGENPGQASLYAIFLDAVPFNSKGTGVSGNPLAPKRPLLMR